MKKLLVAIVLLLVFGITSAAISLGRGGFGSSGGDASSGGGGGGSSDVVPDTRGVRSTSVDAGSFSIPQGTGSYGYYMLSGNDGQRGGDVAVGSGVGGNAGRGQGNDLSFEGWLQKSAELYARATSPSGNADSVGDGSRNGYSGQAPAASLQTLGSAGPGLANGAAVSPLVSLPTDPVPGNTPPVANGDTITASVPEPETYAMLLAGLGLVAAVARRRKAGHS